VSIVRGIVAWEMDSGNLTGSDNRRWNYQSKASDKGESGHLLAIIGNNTSGEIDVLEHIMQSTQTHTHTPAHFYRYLR